ncbi:MAG: secretin N-terminal domain-containing protein [Pseudobdellovibrionaceae bacterium]
MKLLSILLITLTATFASAENKIKMYYKNAELIQVIEDYSKASGQKFVIDPAVRGIISIFLQETVSTDEAFNQLSSALAINGYAISKQGDTMVIKSARNIQRDLIEVSTERPSIKPERMYTWVYTVKNVSADRLNRDLRILTSKDGDMAINTNTNQIILSDWVSNLNRVADLLKEVDKPLDPKTSKIVETAKKEREDRKKENAKKNEKKESP